MPLGLPWGGRPTSIMDAHYNEKRGLQERSVRCITSEPSVPALASRSLEINVVFTTVPGTHAALKTALAISRDLDARTLLLVPQVVPLQFPLSRPPVSIAFIEQRAWAVAMQCKPEADVHIQVFLCGDKLKCLLKALRPQSLVVMGGKKRWWWKGPEEKLARVLRNCGHRVIFVNGD